MSGNKDIEYDISVRIPSDIFEKEIRIDYLYNIHQKRSIKEGKISVKWDKDLFNKFFSDGCIFFNGTLEEINEIKKNIHELKNEIKENDNYHASLTEKYAAYKGFHRIVEEITTDYSFKYPFDKESEEIKPNQAIGFIWIPKDDVRIE